MNPDNWKLLKGIRVKNGSVKIYEMPNGKYLVVIKKYMLMFFQSKKVIVVDKYENAEDYILSAKNDQKV